ncbi:MAG: non-canonical purine NTP pyrophosphatase [Acidimicrobiales bacterium]|nr:non-canonical purine NTP pyrophosphatase [Acidimicrobiales bacterium]
MSGAAADAGAGDAGAERRLVAATANPDKLAEIGSLLTASGFEVLPRPAEVPDVVEDGDSLEANARLKAVAIVAASGGYAAVADDTGLEVDALDGAPGIHAARYAGPEASYDDNVDKLLAELARVGATTPAQRRARFRTVALVRWPDGREVVCHGVVEGHITLARRGGGWGYDPVFEPDEAGGRTFGELTTGGKDAISHRGRAFRALAAALSARD